MGQAINCHNAHKNPIRATIAIIAITISNKLGLLGPLFIHVPWQPGGRMNHNRNPLLTTIQSNFVMRRVLASSGFARLLQE